VDTTTIIFEQNRGKRNLAAAVWDSASGYMEMFTTQPGVQFLRNFLDGTLTGTKTKANTWHSALYL
jgi:hypothetical protein